MSYKPIKELLPHREPFLYVDALDEVTDERIVGHRTYTEEDYFFKGHFPGYPVVPGVILVESMAQCGGAGVAQSGILGDKLFFLATVDKVKFRRQVVPGDTVRFEVENVQVSARGIRQAGKAYVGDQVAAEASWLCLMGDKA
ncbi:MAG: 3-hydroxyacyl-ACP dehydratase FabZ [Spirochaetales bacterium]|nr:3-hydroxyacyl-ACP dehydratase FabZ [Spirochaetales bacterium]